MNSWYVITGAFSSGKSTVLARLERRGFRVIPEAAREVIDEGLALGLTLAEIRGDEEAFQRLVLNKKLAIEAALPHNEVIFFDRGVPDTTAYMRLHGFDFKQSVAASRKAHYRGIIILDPLPFKSDYARSESQDQIDLLDGLIEQCYRELDYEIMRIPVLPVEARVKEVLAVVRA